MEETKPCLYCGGTTDIQIEEFRKKRFYIEYMIWIDCQKCGARGPHIKVTVDNDGCQSNQFVADAEYEAIEKYHALHGKIK